MDSSKTMSSRYRKYAILARLLNDEHLSYQRLSSDYLVSRSSIANDIAFIKRLLAKDNVALNFDNTGTFIGGNEEEKQKIIKRVVATMLEGKHERSVLEMFVDPGLIRMIRKTLVSKVHDLDLEVPENYLNDIILSTTVLISRGRVNKHLTPITASSLSRLLLDLDKYPVVYELLESVEQAGIYKFSQDELRYLSYVVLGNGLRFFMQDGTIPISFERKIHALIETVSEKINLDLTKDVQLEGDLSLHLYQMVLRLQADTTVINPLLSDIKKNYPSLFGIVWYALVDFATENHLTISDDEISFVTIHFQAAIERSKKRRRILFVCLNGIGTSALLSAQMRQILPDVSLIQIVSRDALSQQGLSDVALIISTIPLPKQSVPIATISPMLTADDMKKIMNKYIDVVMAQKPSLPSVCDPSMNRVLSLLRGHVYFSTVENQQEAVDYLLSTTPWQSAEAQARYKRSVFQREKLQTTYLGNGFAIPHGDPSLLETSHVSVLFPEKTIKWGNNKADVIVMLMVSKDDKQSMEPIMDLIMQGINNKDWFISKMTEVG